MDISTASGSNELPDLETSASPIDPAFTSTAKGKRKADGDEGDGEEGAVSNKKRRNRKPVTCAQCRRRKLKCDRGFPCGACRDRQEGHLCEWEGAIRLPQPHLTREAEAQELRAQLDRLEGLLGGLSKTSLAAGPVGAVGLTNLGQAVAEENAAEALGLLAAEVSSNGHASGSGQSRGRPSSAAQANFAQLLALLPSKRELAQMAEQFIVDEQLYFPFEHAGSFRRRLSEWSLSQAAQKPFFAALLAAIVACESAWQVTLHPATEAGETKKREAEVASRRYVEISIETLRLGGYLERPDLDVVRTLLVLYHRFSQSMDGRSTAMLAHAIQIGQTLGLHRDPNGVSGFSVLDVEERRRLWYLLVAYDKLDQTRRTSLISLSSYDTLEPTNAHDKDITETGILAQPFPAFTPVLYLSVLTQLAGIAHNINETLYAPKGAATLPLKYVHDQNVALDRIKGGLPALQWQGDRVIPLDSVNLASDRFRIFAHTTVLQLIIRVNRCFLTRGAADSRLQPFRQKCLDAAYELIGCFLGYEHPHELARSPILLHGALNGLLLVAIDILQAPATTPSQQKNLRLLQAMTARLNQPDKPKLVNEVIRVVGALLNASHEGFARSIMPQSIASALGADVTSLTRPLPVSMTHDAFAAQRIAHCASLQPTQLAQVWRVFVESYPGIYAVPDAREWEELLKQARGEKEFWELGLDILA
ncbi:hypothetical protein JCM10908_004234 [Rhodotorula pacifica]|uniref:Zn(II)2Cys6 transcription factor n=1 Tax=Rhodotorula pacifica TaxID=1495444 RepID=UPI00317DB530